MTKKKIAFAGATRLPAAAGAPPHAHAVPPPSVEGVGAGVGAPGRSGAPPRTRGREGLLDALMETTKNLTSAERRELLARLALEAQAPDSGEVRDLDMWSEAVYEALGAHAGAGAGSVPGPGVIRGLVGSPKAWAPVRDFMQSSKLALLKVAERRSVYGLLARLVVQDSVDFCRWSRAPLGPKVVSQRCEHIAGTFDQNFPGYLASGLAPMVAKALVAGGAPR